MIAHVNGEVVEKFAGSLIIDVSGVGYEVQVSSTDFDVLVLHDRVKVYTYHHVREQSEDLYGFTTLAGKKIFELLITVQGVGPKAALAILSLGVIEEVRNAIANSDSVYITKASGVGKKTAERVVVDLSDKVGLPTSVGGITSDVGVASAPSDDDAMEALMALGYSLADATKALEGIDHDLPTSERITRALKN